MPTLTYAAETWTCTMADTNISRLIATDMKFLRSTEEEKTERDIT
jgi:hypothetical protein